MRYVAILGLFLMLGGLGVFGFGILSAIDSFRSDGEIPGLPPAMIYGFGIAVVGAILYQLGLALGVPRKLEDRPYRPAKSTIVSHSPGAVVHSKVKGGVHVQITTTTYQWLDYLDQSLDDLDYLPKGARQAMAEVRDSVEAGDPQEAGSSLERLTAILAQGGALAGAAASVIQGIEGLARVLGPYGAGALRLLGLP